MLQANSTKRRIGCGTVLEYLSRRVKVLLEDMLYGIRNKYVVSNTKLSKEMTKIAIEIQKNILFKNLIKSLSRL